MWIYKPYSFANTKNTMGGYFDPRPSMSYGTKIVIWIGARRIGKTFSAKKWLLNKLLRNDTSKIAWLRDSDEARQKLASNHGNKFFSDTKKIGIPNVNGRIEGETIFAFGRCVGYLMPSSTFQNYKGNDFEDIHYIVFDEFIAEKGKKVTASRGWEILNMLYTICSTRKNVKIIMLANALDRNDDFLRLLDVEIKEYGLYINREKDVCIHYCDDHPDFIKMREESVIGKIIKGTEFEENLFNNKFADGEDRYYDRRPQKCVLFAILHASTGSVRLYAKDGVFYASKDINLETQQGYRYVNRVEDVKVNRTLIPKPLLDVINKNFGAGYVWFENPFVKKVFVDFVKKL